MECLVPQLLLHRGELGDRRLEPIVLEQQTGLPGVRLEQANLLRTEPCLVVHVPDQHDPHRAAFAVQDGREGTGQPALLQQRARLLRASATPERDNALFGQDSAHEGGFDL